MFRYVADRRYIEYFEWTLCFYPWRCLAWSKSKLIFPDTKITDPNCFQGQLKNKTKQKKTPDWLVDGETQRQWSGAGCSANVPCQGRPGDCWLMQNQKHSGVERRQGGERGKAEARRMAGEWEGQRGGEWEERGREGGRERHYRAGVSQQADGAAGRGSGTSLPLYIFQRLARSAHIFSLSRPLQ